MKMPRLFAAFLLTFCVTAPALAADEKAEQIFVRRIASLFAEKCLACHGKDEAKIKGSLDLRTLAATLKGGDSGKPAIVAGKPEASPLYLAVTWAHDDDWKPMPPKEADKLYGEQVAGSKTGSQAAHPGRTWRGRRPSPRRTRWRGRRRMVSR